MDIAKLRIIAGAGAAFFGFAGTCGLAVATVFALAPVMGWAWAAFTVSCLLFSLGLVCVVVFLKPGKPTEVELDQFENATAQMLAELPFDTIASLVEKRPIAASAMALAAGYLVVSNPQGVSKGLQKLAEELI